MGRSAAMRVGSRWSQQAAPRVSAPSHRQVNLRSFFSALTLLASVLLLMPALASGTSTGLIKGKVTKASDSAAIEGIEACVFEASGEYGGCATTNASGEYTITGLPTGSYKVEFSPSYGSNYLTQYYNGKSSWEDADLVAVTAPSTTSGINAQMHEGGQIKGKVTKAVGGAAVEGIDVCAEETGGEGDTRCAYTNATGEYTITGLPTGSYKVEFSPSYGSNYLTQYYNGKSSWEDADLVAVTAPSTTSGINAQMHEGGQIKGKVTKAVGGAAVEGIDVCAEETGGEGDTRCAYTNATGEYTIIGLPTGSYKVEFSPSYGSNYLTQYYNGKSSWEDADLVAVTAPSTTSGINAQMHEGGQIKGKVTKAVGGAAVEGIDVCAEETGGEGDTRCAYTNATGEYTITGLPTGSYKVEFSPSYGSNYLTQYYNGKSTQAEADAVSVTEGAITPNINAAMHEGGQIKGKVTKAVGGAVIEGVQVCAYDAGSAYEYEGHCAYTTPTGEYTISGLSTGSHKVKFSPPYGANYVTQYYNGKFSLAEADAVSVSADVTTSNINAAMHEGGQIKGKVTKVAGGAAIEGIEVCTTEESHCGYTNASGDYTIAGLPTGSYKVKFSPGYTCTPTCITQNYLTQYYNGKSTQAEAEAVPVTEGAIAPNINAAMHEGGQIKGKVTKASGGSAFEGVEVCTTEGSHCALSNATGEYTITGLPTGSYKVEFSPSYGSNYLTQYYNGKSTQAEAEAVAVTEGAITPNINAAMHEGGQIKGKVTKAVGGAGIEDIDVCALESGGGGRCVYTNASGEYTIAGLPTGSYKVKFSPGYTCTPTCITQNYLTQYYNGKSSSAEADAVSVSAEAITSSINAAMHEGGQIKGKVTKAAGGAAIKGIEVCAYEGGGGYEYEEHCASTSSGGEYTIAGLPTGSYKVKFSPGYTCTPTCITQNYLTQYYNGKSSSTEADAVAITVGATTTDINAAMHEGGQIKGKVTKASGGAAIQGIEACAHEAGDGYYGSCASTNASGEYVIMGLPTGSYKVKFSPGYTCTPTCITQNYLTQYYNGKSTQAEAEAVAVTEEATTLNIDAKMKDGGQIKGKVIEAGGVAMIEGVQVCAYDASGSFEYGGHCASTSSSGEYTIAGLPTGSYKVQFSPGYTCTPTCITQNYLTQYYNGKSSLAEADAVSVTAGATTTNINAAMHKGGQIKGEVTKASGGAAIEDIEVCAHEAGGGYYGSCVSTNASGEYVITGLSTGSYKVEFSPGYESHLNYLTQYYNGKSSLAEADAVLVTAGATTPNINAQMHDGGQIKGKVTKAVGGAAIQGIEACAYKAGAEEAERCAQTDSGGNYTLVALPTGSYKVKFYGGNYLTQYYNGKSSLAEADAVLVTAGATTPNINAQMHDGGQIKGKVTKAVGGAAIQGIEACAYKAGAEEAERCAQTDSGGNYTLVALPTGSYQVGFRSGYDCGAETCTQQNYARQFYNNKSSRDSADLVSVTAGATKEGINAAMQTGGKISGRVTAVSSGEPVDGAYVCAYRNGEEEADGCEETYGNGEYAISGLSSGPHKVEFQPGFSCGLETCIENNYEIQFYDNKTSLATADSVSVTMGAVYEGVDAAMVQPSGAKPRNTVRPQLTGTPAVGQTLTCSQGSWEHNPTSYAYAWLRDGGSISGQIGDTYEVQSADAGDEISCRVTATNGFGSTAATSSQLRVPAKPVNTALPSLTGTPAVGQTLTCSQGSWEHNPTSYAYAWLRGSSPISDQAEETYEVQVEDQGHSITCEVTATNDDGAASATSNSLAVPAAAGAPKNTALPSLTGTPAVGQTLTCSQGSWEHNPTSYAYAWLRDGGPISGQTGGTYEVHSADAGHGISCEVTATNGSGSASATSSPLQVPAKPVSTTPPQLTGTPAVGQTLTCSQGSWEHNPTSYAYAWLRDGSAISGQTASAYTVQSADAGHSIACKVTATTGGGSASATSNSLQVPALAEEGGGGGGGGSPGGGGTPGATPPAPFPSPGPKPLKCKKGLKKIKVKGKTKCVKVKNHNKKRH